MADKISVIEFLSETKDDVNSPTTSTFTTKMSLCRATIAALEEVEPELFLLRTFILLAQILIFSTHCIWLEHLLSFIVSGEPCIFSLSA